MDCHRNLTVRYHGLPQIRRQEIILPEQCFNASTASRSGSCATGRSCAGRDGT